MKIIFFGTPEFAVPSLKMLVHTKGIEIVSVVTQPDKAIGRKQVITPPPVKKTALELGIEVIQPKTSKRLLESLKNVQVDFFVVIAYGMIIPEELLKTPRYGCVNVHASLLPKYRGASPIHESLLNGDKETGISIIKLDKELDHGDIFFIKRIKIEEKDTFPFLNNKLSETSSFILPLVLNDIMTGKLPPIPQNHKNATFCRKIEKDEGKINWTEKTAENIKNMIRAYTPWPSVYTTINNKTIKILEADTAEENITPGKFLVENNTVKIGTKKGCLIPKVIQVEGKKPMDIKSFLNGYRQILK